MNFCGEKAGGNEKRAEDDKKIAQNTEKEAFRRSLRCMKGKERERFVTKKFCPKWRFFEYLLTKRKGHDKLSVENCFLKSGKRF